MSAPLAESSPQVLLSSTGRSWRGLKANLLHIPRGLSRVAGRPMHSLGIHFGPPVNADCCCGGQHMRRVQKSGDIDFIPAGLEGSWEDDADCQILQLEIHPTFLNQVADELGQSSRQVDYVPRFQLRDMRIEAIGLAVKADLEAESPSDPLYIDLLAHALAIRLIETARGSSARIGVHGSQRLSRHQARLLTEFIETNLDQKLNLTDLAVVIGVSVTRLKILFRNSFGVPVYQYVIRRRVEYARALIATTTMPASEVALAAGFAHQSHMVSTMRRILGRTPRDIAGGADDFRLNLQKPV